MLSSLVEDFRAGRRTPREDVAERLERIKERNRVLYAWTECFDDEALREAEDSTERWQSGRPLSPLDGVAVGIKDIVDVAGHVTGAGVPWRRDVATEDAAIVAQLRRLGLIPIGKTVTTALACFDPAPTVHPMDAECTPGGSSSGSAVAVADRHVPLALATQTGGSIIRPASYCGVTGFKPTFGRLPLGGVVPVSARLDHMGFIVRGAEEAACVWAGLSGARDTAGAPCGPRRVGDLASIYAGRASDGVVAAHRAALRVLEDRGVSVERVDLPLDWEAALREHRVIMAVDAAAAHGDLRKAHFDAFPPNVGRLIDEGSRTDRARYEEAKGYQRSIQRAFSEWFAAGAWEALVMPSTSTTAPRDRHTTGDPSFNSVWTLLGVPVLTTPAPTDGESLPCGLQWIGLTNDDRRLCRFGWWFSAS